MADLKGSVNKIFNLKEDWDSKVPEFRKKVKQMYSTSETEYNPFLDKSGNLINPYINYQKVLDNPGITQKAKDYITQATGMTPTVAQTTYSENAVAPGESTDYASAGSSGTQSTGNQFVDTAKKFLGTPYVWGGASPSGFDCSGLVQYVYAQNGIDIPRVSYDQYKSGSAVSKENLQAGDVVFFKGSTGNSSNPGHVGIYIGDGQYIQAPKTGDVVKISNLSGRSDYVGARRYY